MIKRCLCVWLSGLAVMVGAQTVVRIDVDAGKSLGAYAPVWNFFGADEPNYATEADGKKLLKELAELPKGTAVPVYFRAHNLLTTGDGTGSLKWGSTNAYTEDAAGKPVYDWTVTDRIFDAYKEAGITPLVEVSFMPEALSTHPEPYRHTFPNGDIYTGWTYPPKDYAKWAALVQAWAGHLRVRYGAAVDGWLWEVWNEPDIRYWHGTAEEYDRLYDFTADAIRKAVPEAKVGGPEMTGPYGEKGAAYLRAFLEHCARGKNAATGGVGAPLAFVSFHPKGSPKVVDGHVRMGIANQLVAADNGFKVVAASGFKGLPIVMGEFDPEGCAACSGANLGYRNGPLYGVSVVEAEVRAQELAARDGVNLQGAVTWAFEFEGKPYFAGYRDLATNGVDKAVLNAFRMMGMLGGERVMVSSDGGLAVDSILKEGVRGTADVNAVATRKGREVDVLVWNYHDDDVAVPSAAVSLMVKGLQGKRVRVREFRMDAEHGNAYAVWVKMGSPEKPTEAQYAVLEKAGKLAELGRIPGTLPGSENPDPGHPAFVVVKNGRAEVKMDLPRQGVELVRVSW